MTNLLIYGNFMPILVTNLMWTYGCDDGYSYQTVNVCTLPYQTEMLMFYLTTCDILFKKTCVRRQFSTETYLAVLHIPQLVCVRLYSWNGK